MDELRQCIYRVSENDNVATALADLDEGTVKINGAGKLRELECREAVKSGHKLAVTDIPAGTPIVKYGVIIGDSTIDIKKGCWVHLHNMKSRYDSRSSTLDVNTGAPTDTQYI